MEDVRYRFGPSMASRDEQPTVRTFEESDIAPRAPQSDLDLAGRRRLSDLVESMTGREGAPEQVGRFQVETLLGEGAFGEVYLATDPDLRRPLALKLLKQSASSDAVARLRKEAQAMAALDHPDLLTVYEIGSVGERAFIAMELAEGGTLKTWAQSEPRSFADIARHIETAARGLAAAHEAGFVHRDVKPSNILVGSDGRAKVADFGLVHVRVMPAEVVGEDLQTTLAGTPAYMAPEQFDGVEPTDKADQYALGVTFFELIYGRRPSKYAPAISDAGVPSHREQPPRRVPGWIREVLYRSLRFDPEGRYPSMLAFADALRSGIDQRRRRVRGVIAGVALASAAVTGWWARPEAVASTPCPDQARAKIASVWSSARADAMSDAFENVEATYAAALGAATKARIDARVTAWVDAWAQTCDGTRTSARVEEASCLERQRGRLDALLETPLDGDTIDSVASALGDALDPDACAQSGTRPATRAAVTDTPLARRVQEAEVILARGAFADAYEDAMRVLEEAKAGDETRVLVDAGMLAARAALEQEAPADAEAPLEDALNAALAVGLDVQASEAALMLARAVAQRTEPDEAVRWAELGVSLATRSGRSVRERARALTVLARTKALAQDLAEAAERCEEAMALADAAPGGATPQSRLDCGRTWVAVGRFEDARPQLEQAIEGLRARYGPVHPEIAMAMIVLGGVFDQASLPQEALAITLEALEMVRDAYGDDDPRILTALTSASGMTNRVGDYDRALELAVEAASLARRTLSPGDRRYSQAVCIAAGFSMGFECGEDTRAFTDDCATGVRAAERDTPTEELSSPVASANAQAWILATLAYQCLEDTDAEREALASLERYVDAENVSFELRTMASAVLANADLDAKRHAAAEARIRDLLERTRGTTVVKLREGMWRTTLTQALAGQGKHAQAREEATEALVLLEGGDDEMVGPERDWLNEYLAQER